LVFKLGADANLPSEPSLAELPLDPPPSRASSEIIQLGGEKYARYCGVCHAPGAVGSTVLPDLRRSGTLSNPASWQEVVRGGMLSTRGMASFKDSLNENEANAIREWVIYRANQDKAGGLY
jgi:quinohemoprotein ethanol dehydrogenase